MITIVATFQVKPEGLEAFKKSAFACVEGSRKEAGNISYKLLVARDDPNKYTFLEEWKDEAAIDSHNASPHFTAFAEAFPPLLASEPSIVQNDTAC